MSSRFHWPMHGPQAFASTVAPMLSSASIWPSRRIVSSTVVLPGVTMSGDFVFSPAAAAWRASEAARSMSS